MIPVIKLLSRKAVQIDASAALHGRACLTALFQRAGPLVKPPRDSLRAHFPTAAASVRDSLVAHVVEPSTHVRAHGEQAGLKSLGGWTRPRPSGFYFPICRRGEDTADAPHQLTWPSTPRCIILPFTPSPAHLLTLLHLGAELRVFKIPVCPCPQV